MAPAQIDQLPELMRLGVALAIGLLTGLERGWERREVPIARRTAGLRTFGAIGLLGGATAQLGGTSGGVLIAALAIALGLVLAVGYWRESEIDRDVSLTTSVTALVTYSLGALAGRGEHVSPRSSSGLTRTWLESRHASSRFPCPGEGNRSNSSLLPPRSGRYRRTAYRSARNAEDV